MKRLRLLSIILAILCAFPAVSCGNGTQPTPGGDTQGSTEPEETTEAGYPYPDEKFDDYEFTFYSADKQFNCYIRVDFEEQSGEKLDDAVYTRNRKVEEKLGVKIREYQSPNGSAGWATGQAAMCTEITQMVMAGDSDYDAAYLPPYFQPAVVADGYLADLRTIPELSLDSEWWDSIINDELTINDRLYTASSPLQFMSLDLAWVLLFNENMMDDLKMAYPYDLVRDGKWTLDELNKLVTGVASLNGAESFTWDPAAKTVYGVATHTESPDAFIFSAGNRLMTREGDTFKFTGGTERMYSTIDKLALILNQQNGNSYANNGSDLSAQLGYLYAFSADRALFLTCELKATLELRDMNSNFGLLPMPKFDESQDDYITYVNPVSCLLCVPKTNPDLHRTGVILDALSYESWKSVLPVYYDVTVSQKGLRNEDSIEMLTIVRNTRNFQMSGMYGITSALSQSLAKEVMNGTGTAASTIASAQPTVEKKLADLMEAFAK